MQHSLPVVLAAVLAVVACDGSPAPTAVASPAAARAGAMGTAGERAAQHRLLASIRQATARYHRVEVAVADGYVNTRVCASSPAGAMGIHYVQPARRADATFEPTRPEVLVYEPQKNGRLRLVAVEYFIWRALWDDANPGGAGPALLDQPFFRSFGLAAHGEADHYELHVWLWRHNPSGMFAQWNPTVTCAYAPQL